MKTGLINRGIYNLPSWRNICLETALIGLSGTLRVAFVRKARLTLFHFESCPCISDARLKDSSPSDCYIGKRKKNMRAFFYFVLYLKPVKSKSKPT